MTLQQKSVQISIETIRSTVGGYLIKKQLHSPNCASLNVCGLERKLHYPDFCELVNKYDLFCVCETKLEKYDVIDLHSCTFISQCRKQKFIRKSGGLGVFVRNGLSEYITQLDSESDYIMWLEVNKYAFKTNEDLYLGWFISHQMTRGLIPQSKLTFLT